MVGVECLRVLVGGLNYKVESAYEVDIGVRVVTESWGGTFVQYPASLYHPVQ